MVQKIICRRLSIGKLAKLYYQSVENILWLFAKAVEHFLWNILMSKIFLGLWETALSNIFCRKLYVFPVFRMEKMLACINQPSRQEIVCFVANGLPSVNKCTMASHSIHSIHWHREHHTKVDVYRGVTPPLFEMLSVTFTTIVHRIRSIHLGCMFVIRLCSL